MDNYSFGERILQSNILLNKYPDRIPLVIENNSDFNEILIYPFNHEFKNRDYFII